MGNSIRWTPETLAEYLDRAHQRGAVTTHKIADDGGTKDGPKKGGRKSKYGNIKAEADGQIFASKHERTRWMTLRLMEKAGGIKDLRRQVAYPIEVNGLKVCGYVADFVYDRGGELVVEDAKGYRTDVYRLKAKLMLAVHGITVLET